MSFNLLVILGPTASGKTTLADILLGLLEPDSGEIVVDECVFGKF